MPQTPTSEGVPFNGGHSGKGEAEEGDVDTKMNELCVEGEGEGDGKAGGGGALAADPDVDREAKVADELGGERGGQGEGEGIEEREEGEGKGGVAEEE